jgi:hypothetical protein
MPVLIEGVTVLIKRGALFDTYKGGYDQFIYDLQDQSALAVSNDLVRISFEDHASARAYQKLLVERGLKVALINENEPARIDAVLIDQVFGASMTIFWLNYIAIDHAAKPDRYRLPEEINNFSEKITVAATDDELDGRENIRLGQLINEDVGFPSDWERKKQKALALSFMRMSESRSLLEH